MKKIWGTISLIGLGRVGLPLSLAFAEAGFKVFGIDIDLALIKKLEKKQMPFMENGAESLLKKYANNTFFPTSNYEVINKSDCVILTLGTPVDEHLNPDYNQIDNILPILKRNLKKGQLIILRSTIAPGTTELIKDYLEDNTNLKVEKDFYLAFCPERIAEGNSLQEIKEIPQIIGGIGKRSSELAKELFIHITKECLISDAKSAELAKIFSNMYRYINFAIANEFTILAMEHGKNIYEILELVNKNYKRGGIAQPGFTAGPCLYKDGFFLLNAVPFNELISVSWRINENLPLYLLNKLKELTDLKNKKVAILGLTFKKNIDDIRNSLSFKLKKAFLREQSKVILHDPFVKEYNTELINVLKDADVIVIAINHEVYKKLNKSFLKNYVGKKAIICDIWDITKENKIIYTL
jgi:UDP-N-acetyl-D-mannosaminuronic acid dehydrogenase